MKNLQQNQQGISHIIMIVVFALLLIGAAGFAYTQVKDGGSEDVGTSESAEADSEDETDTAEEGASEGEAEAEAEEE